MIITTASLILLNSAICLSLFIKKCRQNSPFQFFYLSLFAIALLPGIWEMTMGFYSFHPFAAPIELSPRILGEAHLKILPMMLSFLLFDYVLGRGRVREYVSLPPIEYRVNVYDAIAVLFVLVAILGVYIYGFGQISTSDFEEVRHGSVNRLFLVMFYLQILVIGIPGFYFLRGRRPAMAAFVLVTFVLAYLLIGGSRQVVVMASAIVLALLMMGLGRSRYFLLILLFTVGFPFMDILLQIVKFVRNLPSTDARIDFLGDLILGKVPLSIFTINQVGSEASIRYIMYGFLTDHAPSDFGNLQYFVRTLLFWLPSNLDVFGIKPDDFEMVMYAEAMGNRSGTMHATFFGSAFADARWLAVVWVGWFSFIFKFFEHLMMKMRPLERSMIWGSCVYFSFMVSRGSFYAPTLIIFMALGVVWLSGRWRDLSLVGGLTARSRMNAP